MEFLKSCFYGGWHHTFFIKYGMWIQLTLMLIQPTLGTIWFLPLHMICVGVQAYLNRKHYLKR